MSKIFDGLKKTRGEIADLTIEVIGDAASPEIPLKKFFSEGAAGEEQRPEAVELIADSAFRLGMLDHRQAPSDGGAARDGGLGSNGSSSPESIQRNSGPKSAVIRLRAGTPLLPFDTGNADRAAEEYRRIRTRILQHPRQPRLVLVSSPSPGDGKSVTALNVAAALALSPETRVLLVDMDLRRPKIAEMLGLVDLDGVSEILAGTCSFEQTVVRLEPFPNLFLLPAGKDRRNPTELLTSPHWKALCEDCRSFAAYTVFDGPPVDGVAEYSLLQERSDGLLLVIRTDHTERSLISGSLQSIPKDKLLGSVINGYKESLFWKKRGGYYYS